jgi:septum formation protein
MTLILASASATRAKMLRDAGVTVEIVPSGVDEDAIKRTYRAEGRPASDLVIALAEAKAQAVNREGLVLGSDQVLNFNGEVFDKPNDMAAARAQMQSLRGQTHELLSAAVLIENGETVWQSVGRATLTMRDFTEDFLDTYLAAEGEAVLWTVGGYRIEGIGAQLFERVEGDYFTILGLPLLDVLKALRGKGVITT